MTSTALGQPTAALPVGFDDLRQRSTLIRALHASDPALQVERIAGGTAYLTRGEPSARPGAVRLTPPAEGFKPADAPKVSAVLARRGLALVSWEPYLAEAIGADLAPVEKVLRGRISEALGCDPWDIELTTQWAVDGITGEGRIDVVTIHRAPLLQPADKRVARWTEIVSSIIPGGSVGWTIDDRPQEGTVTLRYGLRPVLPARVDLGDVLPDSIRHDEWSSLPLGVGVDGKLVSLDLKGGPHALLVGPTGSGKTVGLVTLVAQVLTRGHDLIMIDPTKGGGDFQSLEPWTVAWAETLPDARDTLLAIYAEVVRRKGVLKRYSEVKWSDMSPEARKRENIRPLTVLIDEWGSLALEPTVPKGMAPGDPLRTDLEEEISAKATVKLLVGKLAREARFVGVHLQIALQRPDVAVMGSGELRANLTSVVQLAPPGRGVSRDALGMVFSPDIVVSAAEQLALLDDGKSLGLAVVAAEGGLATGLRVAYAPMKSIPALLEERGVPQPTKWVIGETAEELQEILTELHEELPELELSLEDLEMDPIDAALGEIDRD